MPVAARKRAGNCLWLLLLILLLWPDSALHAQQHPPPRPFRVGAYSTPRPFRVGAHSTMTLSAYQERLADALSQLDSGVDLATVQADIAAIKQVELPDGRILDIEPLLADIDNVADARARLETALGQLQRLDNDHTADRLAALDRVTRRLDLAGLSLWERFLRWLGDLLDRIWPQRQTAGDSAVGQAVGNVIGWGVVAVGSLLLAVLLSYWLRRFLGGILTDSVIRPSRTGSGGPATAAEARQQASIQAHSGDYRQAVRSLFLSALLHLRENDLLHYADSQTNREALANLDPDSPVRPHLESVVETFDQVWYGIREPDEQTFDAYSREVNALMAETGPGFT